ncbi:MAG TPA: M20/M25/M40 family metallo-hydrolase [Patescibacteria group bacterium]|nr:M20/M25/M40 family metallo-hydrolase [Patescibacteria group bacterium]
MPLSPHFPDRGTESMQPASLDERSIGTARVYGRGIADDKAPIVMHLIALKRWLATPVAGRIHLKYLLDGEEEAGSPHIEASLGRNRQLLESDLLVLCDGPMDALSRRSVYLGARGDMHLRLRVRTGAQPAHSGNYGLLPNAAWRLSSLLSSMKQPDGRVTIDGFEEDVLAPTAAEKEILAEASRAETAIAGQLGVAAFEGDPAVPYYERLLFHPGFSINQLSAGRPGNQIPVTAEALMEVRLVARQDPKKVFEAIRRHVMARMPDVEIDYLDGVPAARMDPGELTISRALKAATRAEGGRVLVYPSLGGTLPLLDAFTAAGHKYVGLPLVNFDNNQHVGNENLEVSVLPDGIEYLVHLLDELAVMQGS